MSEKTSNKKRAKIIKQSIKKSAFAGFDSKKALKSLFFMKKYYKLKIDYLLISLH